MKGKAIIYRLEKNEIKKQNNGIFCYNETVKINNLIGTQTKKQYQRSEGI